MSDFSSLLLEEHHFTEAGICHVTKGAQLLYTTADSVNVRRLYTSSRNVTTMQKALYEGKSGSLSVVDAIIHLCHEGAADALIAPVFSYLETNRVPPEDELGKQLEMNVISKLGRYYVEDRSASSLLERTWDMIERWGARPWVLVLDQVLEKSHMQELSLDDKKKLLNFITYDTHDAPLNEEIFRLLNLADKLDWTTVGKFFGYLVEQEECNPHRIAALRLLFLRACVTTGRNDREGGNIPSQKLTNWIKTVSTKLYEELIRMFLNEDMIKDADLDSITAKNPHDRRECDTMQLYETCEYLAKLVSICNPKRIVIPDLTVTVLWTAHKRLNERLANIGRQLEALAKSNAMVRIAGVSKLITDLNEQYRKFKQSREHLDRALHPSTIYI